LKAVLQDGNYKMYFRPDEVSLSDDGISVKIKNTSFYDGNKSLYTCLNEDKKEIKLLLTNNLQEKFKFIPVKPVFF
jgi:multiple sugar transport system ATP-binding protein